MDSEEDMVVATKVLLTLFDVVPGENHICRFSFLPHSLHICSMPPSGMTVTGLRASIQQPSASDGRCHGDGGVDAYPNSHAI